MTTGLTDRSGSGEKAVGCGDIDKDGNDDGVTATCMGGDGGGVGGRYGQGDVEAGVCGKDVALGCGGGVLSLRRPDTCGDVPIFRQVAASMARGLGLPISDEVALGSWRKEEKRE